MNANNLHVGVPSWNEESKGYVIPIEILTSKNEIQEVGNILLADNGIFLKQTKSYGFSESYINFSAFGENISGQVPYLIDESNMVSIYFNQKGYKIGPNSEQISFVTKLGSEKIMEVMNALILSKQIAATKVVHENIEL